MKRLIALQGSQTSRMDRRSIMMFKTVKTSSLYTDDMNNTDANSIDPNLLKSLKPDTLPATLGAAMPAYGSGGVVWGGFANSGGTAGAGTGAVSSGPSTAFSGLVGTSPINVGSLTTTNPGTVQHTGSGLVFNNNFDSTCTQQFKNCVVAAESTLSTLFTNSLTVYVSFTEKNVAPPPATLSNPNPLPFALKNVPLSYANVTYANLTNALSSTGDTFPTSDPNPTGGSDWSLPLAYARMLGYANLGLTASLAPTTSSSNPDDTLTLNTWYNTPQTGTTTLWSYGQDVINGVIHELSENIMGRIDRSGLGSSSTQWSTMDLFRYAQKDATHSSNWYDTSNGTDGNTTYFSSDGGKTLSPGDLSFYGGTNGDTDDWKQNAVFGTAGEPAGGGLTLNQTELNIMTALGWNTQIPQAVFTATPSGDWQTPTNWRDGFAPITPQDALIGSGSNSTAVSSANVTVNSIATDKLGTLEIAGNSVFTATNGTQPNPNDNEFSGGNNGNINVDVGSTLHISTAFYNNSTGTVTLGTNSNSGNGTLALDGTVTTLFGGGTLNLGQASKTIPGN
jgi:hypothetical protein